MNGSGRGQILAACLGLWVGLLILAYFVDWPAMIPIAFLGLGGLLLLFVTLFSDG
jgi:hypothetical protein